MVERLLARGGRRADTVLAVCLVAFAGLVIHEAGRLPPPFFDPLGSAAVPRLVAGLLIVLAACLVGRSLATPPSEIARKDDMGAGMGTGELEAPPAPWVALGAVVAPILYLLAMQFGILGFAPASSLFVLALGAILARGRASAVLSLVPVALVAGYGLNALLTHFFYIDLPQHSFWTMAGLTPAGWTMAG